ncbi:hypothetical protein G6011_00297 [Alternaria panax]|uniref:Uncharacterized protein n=1 Tax=Alternaria panax TaxID=48097 RepID=A0AAD4IHY5_9PLEO|nr:hypothetical protein G6011_00297 [Alternaria panax]
MTATNSNKTKPKRFIPHINMDFDYGSDSNGPEVAENNLQDGESDSDNDERIGDLNIGSHNFGSWQAYNKEGKRLKNELSIHVKDNSRKEVARIQ